MRKTTLALSLLALSSSVFAAERFTVTESVLLDTSADQAWHLIHDFAAIDTWHPAVTKTEITTGTAPNRGAIRLLTIGNSEGMVRETLTAYNDEQRSISYVINETDVLPVADYAATMSVVAVSDDLTLVVWSGDFMSNPPEGQPDSMAQEVVTSVFRAGLDQLKTMTTEAAEATAETAETAEAAAVVEGGAENEAAAKTAEAAESAADAVTEAAESVTETASEVVESAADAVTETAGEAADAVTEAAESAAETVEEAADEAVDAATDATN